MQILLKSGMCSFCICLFSPHAGVVGCVQTYKWSDEEGISKRPEKKVKISKIDFDKTDDYGPYQKLDVMWLFQ